MDNLWLIIGITMGQYIYIYIWVNLITTSLFSRTLEIMVYTWEIIPFYGRKIQVSEILFHLPRYICLIGGIYQPFPVIFWLMTLLKKTNISITDGIPAESPLSAIWDVQEIGPLTIPQKYESQWPLHFSKITESHDKTLIEG